LVGMIHARQVIGRTSLGCFCAWLPSRVPLRSWLAEARAVFRRHDERFDHVRVPIIAIELIQLRQPEIVARVRSAHVKEKRVLKLDSQSFNTRHYWSMFFSVSCGLGYSRRLSTPAQQCSRCSAGSGIYRRRFPVHRDHRRRRRNQMIRHRSQSPFRTSGHEFP
jgi:hypothetical protein